jgi:uncharacterized protein YbgA (DUF1722 family)
MPSNSRLKATAGSYKLVLISHANEREREGVLGDVLARTVQIKLTTFVHSRTGNTRTEWEKKHG